MPGALGGRDLWDRKTNFGSLGPGKGSQPVSSLPVVVKHCSACSFLSVGPPVEDPDKAQAKKPKSVELEIRKEVAKGYRDDPLQVPKRFEFIIKNQNPDWEDVDLLLGEMTETRRQLVLNTAQVQGAETSEEGLRQFHQALLALHEQENKPRSSEKGLSPLTEAMEREIAAAFAGGEPNEVISSAFKINITREDICTLRRLCWLNDEVINFYMMLLIERSKKAGYPTLHAFSTFFYRKLVSGGYQAVRRWTRGVDLFKQDLVLVPIHLTDHWTLAAIDMRKKTIKYLDSLGQKGDKICATLFQYLQEESREKRKMELPFSEWTLRSMEPHEIPQQFNNSDCGMFLCKYADYISQDKPLAFTQSHMPYFRRRMVWEILHQELL
ncbi:PREDICTED: sentrin-specific protease 2-like [Leptosomus discolor]|uniref:sentrin-specific protease 2-like n=1 Tax=Leptosomus discolor TaxID=188344 RepID=UPI000522C328|nr:PREDICTED: sentrin-specific protease 2-like [Leptosomus discolor]